LPQDKRAKLETKLAVADKRLAESTQRLAERDAQLAGTTQQLAAAHEDAASKGADIARISDELQKEQERVRGSRRREEEHQAALEQLAQECDHLRSSLAAAHQGLASANAAQRVPPPTADAACDAMPLPSSEEAREQGSNEESAPPGTVLEKVATQIGTKVGGWVTLLCDCD